MSKHIIRIAGSNQSAKYVKVETANNKIVKAFTYEAEQKELTGRDVNEFQSMPVESKPWEVNSERK
ncbi:MAG: hypothetical protein IPM56_16110 [Ignavibacteriales bacterium]|nr:MAG: hypothetical protein IPM56_16110 [Ignavibacteriales bacterium]